MGLDMYLNAKRFLWRHDGQKDETLAKEINAALKLPPLSPGLAGYGNDVGGVSEVEIRIGYWRKDNHIHRWFVDNVQGGVDECQEADVSFDKLRELKKVCEKVLENRSEAADLLPTQGGFFFGCTDYDEGYFESVERTIKIVDQALMFEDESFTYRCTYQSSW